MPRNIVKVLENDFSDLKAGQKMLISSPEKIEVYINRIATGDFRTTKQMRLDLAAAEGADNTCPVTTGIFLRELIVKKGNEIPYWRVIDEYHPLVKKINLDSQLIRSRRECEKKHKK